jgi:MinD superfamily P-loop ATPase
LNKDVTEKISSLCYTNKIDVIGKIKFDETFSKALETGNTIMESSSTKLKNQIRIIWEEINRRIN